jgi:hypothetical protein
MSHLSSDPRLEILLEVSPFRLWERLAVNLQVREKTSHLKIASEGKTHVQGHLLTKINGFFKLAAHLPCLYSYEKGPSSSFCNLLNLVSWVLTWMFVWPEHRKRASKGNPGYPGGGSDDARNLRRPCGLAIDVQATRKTRKSSSLFLCESSLGGADGKMRLCSGN